MYFRYVIFFLSIQIFLSQALKANDWLLTSINLLESINQKDSQAATLRSYHSYNSWQNKCFALWALNKSREKLPADLLQNETHPLVLRMASAFELKVNENYINQLIANRLNTSNEDELLVYIELCIMSGDTRLIEKAKERLINYTLRLRKNEVLPFAMKINYLVDAPFSDYREDFRSFIKSDKFKFPIALNLMQHYTRYEVDLTAVKTEPDYDKAKEYFKKIEKLDRDLVLCIDGTGSMGFIFQHSATEIERIFKFYSQISNSFQMGIVVYRDKGSPTDILKLTPDLDKIRKFIFNIKPKGGGDNPESLKRGLEKISYMGWRLKSDKQLVVVTDSTIHTKELSYVEETVKKLKDYKEIKTHGITFTSSEIKPLKDLSKWGGGSYTNITGKGLFLSNEIIKLNLDPVSHSLFDEFFNLYKRICQ